MTREMENSATFPPAETAWQPTPISTRRRWFLVSLLSTASLINYLDRATISVALPKISEEFLLRPAAEGLLLSAFFWSYTLMQLPMGYLVDRRSLRWLYAGSFALWSLACGLAGFAESFAMLFVLRIALGIGESIFLPGSIKFISVSFPPQDRGLPTGIFSCGTRAGLALGAPLIAWLVSRYGWRHMFVLVGFAGLAWIIPWLLAFPSGLGQQKLPATSVRPVKTRRKIPTLNRNLVGACLGFLSFGYYGYLLVTWLPDYFVEARHLSILRAGVYSSIPFFVWTAAEPAGGWLADRLTRHGWNHTRVRKGLITFGYSAGLFLIPAVLSSSMKVTLFMLAGASLVGLSTANLLVVFQSCAPPEEVGAWMGIGNFVGNLGGVLSPAITGFLIQRTGSYVAGFALAPIILVAGLLAYWLMVGELKPPPATETQHDKTASPA